MTTEFTSTKTTTLASTKREFKRKFTSMLGTFGIFAVIQVVLSVLITHFSGAGIIKDQPIYVSEIFVSAFSSFQNMTLTLFPIFITGLVVGIFTLLYSARNSQIQSLTFGVSRKTTYITHIFVGISFAAVFSVINIISDLIFRIVIFTRNGDLIYNSSKGLIISDIFISFFACFAMCFAVFICISVIMNAIMRKRFLFAIIPILVTLAFFLGGLSLGEVIYARTTEHIRNFFAIFFNHIEGFIIVFTAFSMLMLWCEAAQTFTGGIKR